MSDQYPLTKSLGVIVYNTGESAFVRAADLERVLESAPVVCLGSGRDSIWKRQPTEVDTHTARLLCVQPIVWDTAESLLREFVAESTAAWKNPYDMSPRLYKVIERARALLGEK